MSKYFTDVAAFHEKFCLPPHTEFFLPQDMQSFRALFLNEEFQEYIDSYEAGDLGTAIDSLVDLIYIVNGTAYLHGMSEEEWGDCVFARLFDTFPLDDGTELPERVSFLSRERHERAVAVLREAINEYSTYHLQRDEQLTKITLARIYTLTFDIAVEMGLTRDSWQEFWDDVQRANMSKERVLRAEDSKRGSTYDVRKPVGWIPPRTEEILAKYI